MIQRIGKWTVGMLTDKRGRLTLDIQHDDGSLVLDEGMDRDEFHETNWKETFYTESQYNNPEPPPEPVKQGECPNCGKTGDYHEACPDCPDFWFADVDSLPK